MTQTTTIEYKGIEFDVEFDWVTEDDGVEHVECITEIEHKGTCFMEFLENDIEEGLIEEAIDEATKKDAEY
ncbi:hypothetical protein [uncultured Mediterranean phage uvMED]|nr:hypothetical protein [uncultured Mediterranean phage uvMED]